MSELTKDEQALVKSLVKLWDQAYEKGLCKTRCECDFCQAFDECGDYGSVIWKSLKEKVGAE